MSIRWKILLACLCTAATAVALGVFALSAERRLADLATRIYDEALMSVSHARSAEARFAALRGDFALAAMRGEPAGAALGQGLTLVADDLEVAMERATSPESRAAAGELRDRIAGIASAAASAPPADLLERLAAARGAFDMVVEGFAADGAMFRNAADEQAAAAIRSTQVAIGVALAVALLISLALTAVIVPPLRRAAAVADAVAAGRLDAEVKAPARPGGSETGRLLQALARMQAAIREDRERIAGLAAAEEATRAEAYEAQRRDLLAMATTVERETAGRLETFRGRMTGMARSAGAMLEAAAEVSATSGAVAEAGRRSLDSAETVSTATEELAASIGEISRRVAEAASVARRGVSASEAGGATIRHLAEAVGRIGEVARLIGDIAGRTNLLALNATIEAARAGEAGKGFAVVAGEVKQLASQTAKATEDIGRQVQEIGAATERAVATVDDIARTVGEIDGAAAAIAAAVEQQSAATREISRAVQEAAAAARDVSGGIASVAAATTGTGTRAEALREETTEAENDIEAMRQAIVAIIRNARPEMERRAHPRRALPCRAVLRQGAGAPIEAELADISEGGARLTLPAEARPVTGAATLRLEGLGQDLGCVVLASGDGTARLRFEPAEAAGALIAPWLAQREGAALARAA